MDLTVLEQAVMEFADPGPTDDAEAVDAEMISQAFETPVDMIRGALITLEVLDYLIADPTGTYFLPSNKAWR